MGNTELPSQFTDKQIQKLYARFQDLDKDKSGDLDPEQIFTVPELSQNPLVKRVISVFDSNSDGKISFKQFVQGIASLYSSDDEKKLQFVFNIYDMDKDGFISNGELFTVIKMMAGDNLGDWQLQQLVDRTIVKGDLDLDGKISYHEFKELVGHMEIGSRLRIRKI